MQKNLFLVAFFVSVFFHPYDSYSQIENREPIIQIYAGSNYNKTYYYPFFDVIENDLRHVYNKYTPVFGTDIRLFTGMNFVFEAGGYSFSENFDEYDYQIKMRSFMAGFKLKNKGRPLYFRFLSGINHKIYDFYNIDESIAETDNDFSVGGDIGYIVLKRKYATLNISTGLTRSFDSGKAYNKIYAQIYASFFIFTK